MASAFGAPSAVAGTVQSESVIRLNWKDNSSTEDGFELWMSEAGNAYVNLGDLLFYQTPPIPVTGLSPNTNYRFKMRAYKGTSPNRTYTAFSAESASVKTPFHAPTNLVVVPNSLTEDSTTVTLNWTDNSAGETSFDILARPVGSGSYVVRKNIAGNGSTSGTTFSAVVEKLAPGLSYEFVVRAKADSVSPAALSANSNTASKTLKHKITSPHYAQMLVNEPFTYVLTTSSVAAPLSRDITGLPSGLSFNSATGLVTGAPTAAGVYEAVMQVTFPDSSTETTYLDIRVLNPPVTAGAIASQNLTTGTLTVVTLDDKFTDPEASSAVRVSTSLGNMDLVFFESQTPLTVANFQFYMANDAYTDNLFHRSATNQYGAPFVIQGGAFKADLSSPVRFNAVPTPNTVVNEPGISNIRGTVAMAKSSTDPNSASCQWFINLDDNRAIVDNQNGGFTVFARVAGNGMAVADAIAARPTGDYVIDEDGTNRIYYDWPLESTDALSVMDNTKVIKINSVAPVPVLSYAVTGNTNPGAVSAAIESGNVKLTPVDSGGSEVTVTATTLDGNTVSQTFEVTTVSNVATLSGVALDHGALSPAFDSDTLNYTVAVPNGVTSIKVTPTTTSAHATMLVNGNALDSGAASAPIDLAVGSNPITILVTSEDGSVNKTYTIDVRRSAFEIESKMVVVLEEGGTANIPLTRLPDNLSAVDFLVTTSSGSAISGADFTPIVGQQFTFPASATTMNVPVQILGPGAVESNENFPVTLSGVAGSLSAPETATVVIVDSVADTSNPAVTIASPAAGARLNLVPGASISITGSATDNRGVKRVEVAINGAPYEEAALSPPATGSPTSTTYSFTAQPAGGTNTISVRSIDFRDRVSTVLTRTFTVLRPLGVVADSAQGSVTAGFSPSSYREVGKSLAITAKSIMPTTPTVANAGYIFKDWSVSNVVSPSLTQAQILAQIGVAESSLQKATLSFIFREGLVLTANFEPNPFPAQAGSYSGLVRPDPALPDRAGADDGTKSAVDTEGSFSATVDAKGSFSAKLLIDGASFAFAGAFDADGVARFGTSRGLKQVVARTGKPSLTVALQANDANGEATAGGHEIVGTVTATEFKRSTVASVSNILADKAHYGSQVVPGGLTSGSAIVSLVSTEDRSVGELVSGSGIPANTSVIAVGASQVTLSANATATRAAASLTFTRYVDAAYLNAASADGVYTVVLPAKAPHYEVDVTIDDAANTVNGGTDNVFENDAVVVFSNAPPAPLVAGQEYFVINKNGVTFQVSASKGGGVVDITASGSCVAVLDPDGRQAEGFTAQDYPQGDGFGTVKITKTGAVSFTGTLADGTTMTASSALSSSSTAPIFAQLYSLKGFASVRVKLRDALPLTNDDPDILPAPGTELLWSRPFLLDQYYPYGWPEVIGVGLEGARYDATGIVLRLGGNAPLKAADPIEGNAVLKFTNGQLSEDVAKAVSISAGNAVTKAPDPTDATFSLNITPTTGAISGTFVHTDDTVPAFQGIIFQKGPNSGAYGFFKTKAPGVIDYTGESGGVSLIGKP